MPTRRRGAPSQSALAALIALSVALHAAALVVASALGDDASRDRGPSAASRAAAVEACELDAALAAAVRARECAAPAEQSRAECTREAMRQLELELIVCRGLAGPKPYLDADEMQVALVDPDEIPPASELSVVDDAVDEPEPAPEIDRGAQVVEIPEPAESQRPDEARFLAEYDSVVDRETVARGTTDEMVERPDPEAGRDERAEAEAGGPDSEPSGEGGEGADLAMREPRPGAVGGLDVGALDERGEIPARGDARRDRGEDAARPGTDRPGVPDLRPTDEMLARAMEGSGGSVDHLEGVREGDTTGLNAVQWKHAGFFNRLKREVAQHWKPAEVYRRHDPDGSVYALRDRVTVLRVMLRPDGSVAQVVVVRRSGIDALDQEAVRAFRAAEPFPNPPSELVEPGSRAKPFNFGFYFELRGGRHRIFRRR